MHFSFLATKLISAGLGQAMIQVAQYLGVEIFVTVSSGDKCDLMKKLGIEDDHILNSRDLSFARGIKRMTSGQGVDVIINNLTGEAQRQTWACISQSGRFMQLGKQDALANTGLEMRHFLANASFSSVNVKVLSTLPSLNDSARSAGLISS